MITFYNRLLALLVALALVACFSGAADMQAFYGKGRGIGKVGNVIFLHADGSALQQWNAARIYWAGPDKNINWDLLPEMAVYRGHNSDQLTSTSNGGATIHAFGVKVQGSDSFGRDRGREILALSGYPGSISREAAYKGHPVGLINDGGIANEPGTGAFFAEVDNRNLAAEQTRQLIDGRPGFEGEPDPIVMLGGGERWFLPEGTPQCTEAPTMNDLKPDCFLHFVAVDAADDLNDDPTLTVAEAVANNGPARTDDRNLLQDAVDKGYVLIRTRAQYEELMDKLAKDPFYAPKVLGLFAASDIFNDEEEEELFSLDFIRSNVDPIPPEVVGQPELQGKIGDLLLWGTPNRPFGPLDVNDKQLENPFSVNPPSAAEMTEMAIIILDRRSRLDERKPFHLVCEVESTDNMPNKNNAIGTLRALKRGDDMIKVARDYEQKTGAIKGGFRGKPLETLILTAADSDGSALQILALRRGTTDTPFNPLECNKVGNADRSECLDQGEKTTVTTVNPEFSFFEGAFADNDTTQVVDGIHGRRSEAFVAEPDALSDERVALGGFPDMDESGAGSFGGLTVDDAKLPFAVTWATVQDTAGAIISRAQGMNAELLRTKFSVRFDNTDVYRIMYFTLFGKVLPSGVGKVAEDRPQQTNRDILKKDRDLWHRTFVAPDSKM